MLNESMAVNLLRQYGVTHVAIFISYNYLQGGTGLCSNSAGTPTVCGYGDDSKWYWMVRIGNGTVINTPLGQATVSFRQVVQNTQTGSSVYDRYITIGGHTDNGTQITENYPAGSAQAAAIPLSNTLLGLLERDGYPSGVNPSLTNDNRYRGDARPYFFSQVFKSSNNYVLVYKVNYPQTPVLTSMLSNPYPSTGSSVSLTGTLTSNGLPVSTSKQVHLEFAAAGDSSWSYVPGGNVTITAGSFGPVRWAPQPSSPGQTYHVRAWWNGDPSLGLGMALSANQTLIFH
jgi:hypothetical protein